MTAYTLMALALLLDMPFFALFGALSDRIGRKKVIMCVLFLASVT
ncbi:hypothetical protein [Caballeronia sordidicola]|uniref:Major facilitator superfamily (MFS) profile domain-containing protein n=1 Tax=Caballeronia sordidicola TaxID=196367 RepID=A0A242MUF0_CABSO|nr:hypothetical protein [Caballeronia sordidicola]OTP75067.1 hypothetical protein PAMC26577_14135 [Caballeronia sordidicola]